MFHALVPHAFRVVNDQDFIPTIPKLLWAYKHVGVEVLQDRHGNMIVEPIQVEKTLSKFNGYIMDTGIADHSMATYEPAPRQFKKKLARYDN